MNKNTMRGVYPILVTPFDEQERVDVESLQNLVDFQIAAGVHGLGIALGAEVPKLTESERSLVLRTVVEQVRGRVPVVMNTGGASTAMTVHYSRMAADDGADALMIIPAAVNVGNEALVAFYKAVSDAVDLPVFIQDISHLHVSADAALRIAEACPTVRYIKVESHPTPVMVAETARKASHVLTVFGGAGGGFLIEELRRGSQGTMPGCSCPEAFVQLWEQFHSGDEKGAIATFYRVIAPINRVAEQGWGAFHGVHKEILRQRGAIRTAVVRGPVAPLDEELLRDLQIVVDELYPG